MGGVVDAIGDVVGGVADVAGDVVGGVADVVGDVVETVVDNPELALIGGIFALPYLAPELFYGAAAGTGAGGAGILGADIAAAGSLGYIPGAEAAALYSSSPSFSQYLFGSIPELSAAAIAEGAVPVASQGVLGVGGAFNPFSGFDWLMSGPWLPQIFAGSANTTNTSSETVISSSLAMTQVKVAQAIKRLDVTGFIVKTKTIDFAWENPAMLLIPEPIKQLYGLGTSYTFTQAQALDELNDGILYNKQGVLSHWTLDKVPPYLDIKCVQIKETCINQILVCS